MSPLNRHHLAYERRDWQRNRFTNLIRSHQGMIIPLPMLEIHRPLHIHLWQGVPLPTKDAAKHFIEEVVLPYEPNQPMMKTVDQAIAWFALTDNMPTAEHFAEQRDFILNRLTAEEAA